TPLLHRKMSKTQGFYLMPMGNYMYFLLRVYYVPGFVWNQGEFGKVRKEKSLNVGTANGRQFPKPVKLLD
ncbi:MAG: hypothetical protein ABI476_08140, partial [Oxalobacteraceae bacterium]